MADGAATRVQDFIGDPISEAPVVPRAKLEAIFQDLQADLRFDHELNGCLNCGICTATCPAAHYYDFSPREIVQLLWTENLEGIYDAMQEKIWSCAQCYTCAARCPFGTISAALASESEPIAGATLTLLLSCGPSIARSAESCAAARAAIAEFPFKLFSSASL